MASMNYVPIPPTATRLENKPSSIEPVRPTFTSLPTPSPSPPPLLASSSTHTTTSTTSHTPSPTPSTNAALSAILSSTLPTLGKTPPDYSPKGGSRSGSRGKLLSTRDPLSIPTTSVNFRRFVARASPIFWFQDRVEEVVCWKRGWMLTTEWIAVYAFFCYFPRMFFLLPHFVLVAILLSTYPYGDHKTSPPTPPSSSIDWQGNLQAIQNLMGLISDVYDLIEPLTHHLILTPAHIPPPPPSRSPSPSRSPTRPGTPTVGGPHSPYAPYILLFLLLTFPPLAFIVSSPFFPVRLIIFLAGVLPVVVNHPRVSSVLLYISHTTDWVKTGQFLLNFAVKMKNRAIRRWILFKANVVKRIPGYIKRRMGIIIEGGTTMPMVVGDKGTEMEMEMMNVLTMLERLLDDDRLDDKCWRSEMREVEVWENERFLRAPGTPIPAPAPVSLALRRQTGGIASLAATLSAGPDRDGSGGGAGGGTSVYGTPKTGMSSPVVGSGSPGPGLGRERRRYSMTQGWIPGVIRDMMSPPSSPSLYGGNNGAGGGGGGLGPGMWGKSHLRGGERKGWTRGRDGWGGIRPYAAPLSAGGGSGSGSGGSGAGVGRKRESSSGGSVDGTGTGHVTPVEEDGVSGGKGGEGGGAEGYVSNLTFSLAPGWSFVKSEGWRQDRTGRWAGVRCFDDSGWVYTNDTWSDPRGVPDAWSVTRRRRWVRRVWFDASASASAASGGGDLVVSGDGLGGTEESGGSVEC